MTASAELIARAKTASRILMQHEAWEMPAPPPVDPMDYAWTAQVIDDLLEALSTPTGEAGMVLVPREPTEAMWGGLARAIVMWWGMGDRPTGAALYRQLYHTSENAPQWLRDEIPDIDHVPPKGTVAACIYRAMIDAALKAQP